MPDPSRPSPVGPTADAHDLGVMLAPALRECCEGRLGEIEWFRCAWQHGGAATGFSDWRGDDGHRHPVVIKLPVGSVEHGWTTRLAAGDDPRPPTPRVFRAGVELGGYDLAWLVIERFAGEPVSTALTEQAVHDLLDAAARFQIAAVRARAIDQTPSTPDWGGLLAKARDATRNAALAEAQRWNDAVKRVQRALPALEAKWHARRIECWCHGDLHPANAMRREPGGPCALIDLAMVHAGHWVEDAVYLERLYWGKPEQLHGVKPVSVLANRRRAYGLRTDEDYAGLAAVRRVLMAGCVPAYAAHEGHPKYTHAALGVIEKFLPQVAH